MSDWIADVLAYSEILRYLSEQKCKCFKDCNQSGLPIVHPDYQSLVLIERATLILMQQAEMMSDCPVWIPFNEEVKPEETPMFFGKVIDYYRAKKDYDSADVIKRWLMKIGYSIEMGREKLNIPTKVVAIYGYPSTMVGYVTFTRKQRDAFWQKD